MAALACGTSRKTYGSFIMNTESEYLTLSQAARAVPGRVSVPTVWRWAVHGVGGVRLRSARAGRKFVIKREWLEEFYSELGAAREAERGGVHCETTKFGGGEY